MNMDEQVGSRRAEGVKESLSVFIPAYLCSSVVPFFFVAS